MEMIAFDLGRLRQFHADYRIDSSSLLLNDGDGSFQAAQTVLSGFARLDLVVADVNRDNQPDLSITQFGSGDMAILLGDLVVATTTDLSIWLGAGDGSFSKSKVFPGWTGNYRSAVIADFNGDGVADIAPGNTLFFRGIGAGKFEVERFPNVGDAGVLRWRISMVMAGRIWRFRLMVSAEWRS